MPTAGQVIRASRRAAAKSGRSTWSELKRAGYGGGGSSGGSSGPTQAQIEAQKTQTAISQYEALAKKYEAAGRTELANELRSYQKVVQEKGYSSGSSYIDTALAEKKAQQVVTQRQQSREQQRLQEEQRQSWIQERTDRQKSSDTVNQLKQSSQYDVYDPEEQQEKVDEIVRKREEKKDKDKTNFAYSPGFMKSASAQEEQPDTNDVSGSSTGFAQNIQASQEPPKRFYSEDRNETWTPDTTDNYEVVYTRGGRTTGKVATDEGEANIQSGLSLNAQYTTESDPDTILTGQQVIDMQLEQTQPTTKTTTTFSIDDIYNPDTITPEQEEGASLVLGAIDKPEKNIPIIKEQIKQDEIEPIRDLTTYQKVDLYLENIGLNTGTIGRTFKTINWARGIFGGSPIESPEELNKLNLGGILPGGVPRDEIDDFKQGVIKGTQIKREENKTQSDINDEKIQDIKQFGMIIPEGVREEQKGDYAYETTIISGMEDKGYTVEQKDGEITFTKEGVGAEDAFQTDLTDSTSPYFSSLVNYAAEQDFKNEYKTSTSMRVFNALTDKEEFKSFVKDELDPKNLSDDLTTSLLIQDADEKQWTSYRVLTTPGRLATGVVTEGFQAGIEKYNVNWTKVATAGMLGSDDPLIQERETYRPRSLQKSREDTVMLYAERANAPEMSVDLNPFMEGKTDFYDWQGMPSILARIDKYGDTDILNQKGYEQDVQRYSYYMNYNRREGEQQVELTSDFANQYRVELADREFAGVLVGEVVANTVGAYTFNRLGGFGTGSKLTRAATGAARGAIAVGVAAPYEFESSIVAMRERNPEIMDWSPEVKSQQFQDTTIYATAWGAGLIGAAGYGIPGTGISGGLLDPFGEWTGDFVNTVSSVVGGGIKRIPIFVNINSNVKVDSDVKTKPKYTQKTISSEVVGDTRVKTVIQQRQDVKVSPDTKVKEFIPPVAVSSNVAQDVVIAPQSSIDVTSEIGTNVGVQPPIDPATEVQQNVNIDPNADVNTEINTEINTQIVVPTPDKDRGFPFFPFFPPSGSTSVVNFKPLRPRKQRNLFYTPSFKARALNIRSSIKPQGTFNGLFSGGEFRPIYDPSAPALKSKSKSPKALRTPKFPTGDFSKLNTPKILSPVGLPSKKKKKKKKKGKKGLNNTFNFKIPKIKI